MSTEQTVSARDVIAQVIDEVSVGAWFGQDAAAEVLARLEAAGFAVVDRVWVAELNLDNGAGYVGVCRTREGAVEKLIGWASNVGVDIDEYDYDPENGCEALDDDPGVEGYGVYHLEVEP